MTLSTANNLTADNTLNVICNLPVLNQNKFIHKLSVLVHLMHFYVFRNENKRKKMKKHEKEKEYMTSLKAVSITTKYSAGGCDDSSSESEFSDCSDSFPEPDCSDSVPVTDSSDDECGDELQGNPSPLYFLYDCEGTGGSIYKDHILEIAAVLQPLANNVETHLEKSFHSLVNTSRRIAAPGRNNVLE